MQRSRRGGVRVPRPLFLLGLAAVATCVAGSLLFLSHSFEKGGRTSAATYALRATPTQTASPTPEQTASATPSATPQPSATVDNNPPVTTDVLVYGGTPSGVMAAVAAAREGAQAIILEPSETLGGMAASGISATDYRDQSLVGGLPLELFNSIVARYPNDPTGLAADWAFEPHVVEAAYRSMAAKAGVEVLYGQRLRQYGGVTVSGGKIASITTEDGSVFRAGVFIDASYEGDLLAQAKVPYMLGRESKDAFGEDLAGIGPVPDPSFTNGIPAIAADGSLLPGVSDAPHGTPGAADKSVQSYVYRLCFSSLPADQVHITAPAGYDPATYELVTREIEQRMLTDPNPQLSWVLNLYPLPNDKVDVNNTGTVSTDQIGGNVGYANASYARRTAMAHQSRAWIQGFLYFLGNDPSVPAHIRDQMNSWGLCKDEYTSNGNWPPLLYVREARRLVGEYVLTQADVQTDLTKTDSIGLGQYRIDGHGERRLVAYGLAYNEGALAAPTSPYEIPYRSLIPAAGSVTNLIVTVDVSATHVAWASLRMEPQFMIMGQAGGIAAAMAVSLSDDVASVPVAMLQARLEATGAILHVADARK